MIGLLFSGGMDSTAIAFWKRPSVAFTIDYGQAPADAEIGAAGQISSELGIRHEIIRVDCSALGSGDLAGRPPLDTAPVPEWWPFRNQLLATLAGMRAVSLGITELMFGAVASDGSHADGRRPFYDALDALMGDQEGGLRMLVPAIGMSTVELVQTSAVPRKVLAWAHSCHVGNLACGSCRGCVKHFHAMQDLYGEAY